MQNVKERKKTRKLNIQEIIRKVEERNIEKTIGKVDLEKRFPKEIRVGDEVRVYYTIETEGGKKKTLVFEGTLIEFYGGGIRKAFTVRRVVQGVGVERTFRLFSPNLVRVELIKHPFRKPRRAKLYYLRGDD